MNPIPLFEQASTSLNTSIDNIPLARSLLGRFYLRETFNVEDPSGQDTPYYAMPPQYSYSSPQPMLDVPMVVEITSPQGGLVSAFDYSTHNSYPSSTPGVSCRCDTWAPSFRRNIFNPIDYATLVCSQSMPQPLMSY